MQILASQRAADKDLAPSDILFGSWPASFPSGLESAQLPFEIHLYEDKWAHDVIPVDLGDSCPSRGCTAAAPALALAPSVSRSGFPACDTVMMTKTNK